MAIIGEIRAHLLWCQFTASSLEFRLLLHHTLQAGRFMVEISTNHPFPAQLHCNIFAEAVRNLVCKLKY
jgi:hypothetical protein